MFTCTCAPIYLCTCVCMYMYTYICMYMYVYVYVYMEAEHFYPCSNSLQWPLLQAISLIYQSPRMEAGMRAQSGPRSSLKFICRRFTVTLLSLLRPNHLNAAESAVLHVVAGAATADEEEVPMIPVADCRSRSLKYRRPAHRGPQCRAPRMINDARAVRGRVNEAMTRPTR